jgi:hypothetical protein
VGQYPDVWAPPKVAYNPTTGEFMAVWGGANGFAEARVMAQRYVPDANVGPPIHLETEPIQDALPAVASSGGEWLVVGRSRRLARGRRVPRRDER